MKLRFIYNPFSGKNRRNPRLLEQLGSTCARRDLAAELRITQYPGHATELAREAVKLGCTHVVAVGGDGTMNETAQALVGTDSALGLVPCGSGNGLALHLGIPTLPVEALRLLLGADSAILPIDTGIADGHPFFNAMGVGLDAEISRRFNSLKRRGLAAYVRTTLAALREFRPLSLKATDVDGRSLELRAMLATVANSDQYGNRARIAPSARVNDGEFDLVVLEPLGPVDLLSGTFRLFNGSFERFGKARFLRSSSFLIERDSSGPLHTDGESHQAGPRIRVTVKPRSLNIVVPAGVAARYTLNDDSPFSPS